MRQNSKCADIVGLQQARRARMELAERELARKPKHEFDADMLFWWLIAGCLGAMAFVIASIEYRWW